MNTLKYICYLIIVIIIAACSGPTTKSQTKNKYIPLAGKPNLMLMTGSWNGVLKGDIGFESKSWIKVELETFGKKAGQSDMLRFVPCDSLGRPKTDGWVDNLRIFNDEVSYATTDFPVSEWEQSDSINFNWLILSKELKYDKLGKFKHFTRFSRKKDSLFIVSGVITLADSNFKVEYYRAYSKVFDD